MGVFQRCQDYLQDAAMQAILRRKIIYNVAWEDPRIDGKVLALTAAQPVPARQIGRAGHQSPTRDKGYHMIVCTA